MKNKIKSELQKVIIEAIPTLVGSSLIHDNSVLCCKVKTLSYVNRKIEETSYWAFWDIKNKEMKRPPLNHKIERVFFLKES